MIFVDSGYLVALSQPSDSLHARAMAWASRIDEPLILTQFVLLEVVNHLSSLLDRRRAGLISSIVSTDPNYRLLHVSKDHFNAGLKLHQERPDKQWSLTDCISFLVMHEHNLTRALAHNHDHYLSKFSLKKKASYEHG